MFYTLLILYQLDQKSQGTFYTQLFSISYNNGGFSIATKVWAYFNKHIVYVGDYNSGKLVMSSYLRFMSISSLHRWRKSVGTIGS